MTVPTAPAVIARPCVNIQLGDHRDSDGNCHWRCGDYGTRLFGEIH